MPLLFIDDKSEIEDIINIEINKPEILDDFSIKEVYRASLNKAKALGYDEIVVSLIDGLVSIKPIIEEIKDFLDDNEMIINLLIEDRSSLGISEDIIEEINNSIIDNDDLYYLKEASEYSGKDYLATSSFLGNKKETLAFNSNYDYASIDDVIHNKDNTFQEYLFHLIDKKGIDEVVVYKKANLDRKHFSKIRSNKDYQPSKKTAIALAIALELNLDETKDLLLRAGIALSPSNIFDLIIEYCLNNNIYDIYEINSILYKYNQPILGL